MLCTVYSVLFCLEAVSVTVSSGNLYEIAKGKKTLIIVVVVIVRISYGTKLRIKLNYRYYKKLQCAAEIDADCH